MTEAPRLALVETQAQPLAHIRTKFFRLEFWPGHVRSVFPDGASVTAAPNGTETLLDTALHEMLHHAIAEAQDYGTSHCLRAAADGAGRMWTPERLAEESLAYPLGIRMAETVRMVRRVYGERDGA